MKKLLPLICLTLMLRVWWFLDGTDHLGSGILLSSTADMQERVLIRDDVDGGVFVLNLATNPIKKSKWVEIKAGREK